MLKKIVENFFGKNLKKNLRATNEVFLTKSGEK